MTEIPVIEHPSPNFGPRRDGILPDLVVVHFTAMATAEAALERLCDPAFEVSAHYLVAEDGRIWRLVSDDARAWHAGAGEWRGAGDLNSRSIGIELANAAGLDGFPPFAEPQMAALESLLDGIMARWDVRPEGVIAHSDLAPGRKADPGRKFDWRRLAHGGRSVWPQAVAPCDGGWDGFCQAAVRFGYGTPEQGGAAAVLEAFRQRFRPWARGAVPDGWDVATIRDLAARFGASV